MYKKQMTVRVEHYLTVEADTEEDIGVLIEGMSSEFTKEEGSSGLIIDSECVSYEILASTDISY